MRRKIVTFSVPVTKDNKGLCTYMEAEKVEQPNPQIVEIDSTAEIQRLAVEISQENSRAKKVAESIMGNNSSSTIDLKYLI
jgi:hypothetical protein